MVGAGGTGIALAGGATIYSTGTGQTLLLPALIGFILFFAISQGAVIWVYLSEIFPTAVRARGQSLGSATHWGMNALLAFGFPVVARLPQAEPLWGSVERRVGIECVSQYRYRWSPYHYTNKRQILDHTN